MTCFKCLIFIGKSICLNAPCFVCKCVKVSTGPQPERIGSLLCSGVEHHRVYFCATKKRLPTGSSSSLATLLLECIPHDTAKSSVIIVFPSASLMIGRNLTRIDRGQRLPSSACLIVISRSPFSLLPNQECLLSYLFPVLAYGTHSLIFFHYRLASL